MNILKTAVAAALVLLLGLQPLPSFAGEFSIGEISVMHPKARPNLPRRPVAVYMTVQNHGASADRLVAVSSPEFGAAELHETMRHGDVMKMMPTDGVDLPETSVVRFEPGGLHIMLFDAARRYKAGESFPLTLTFERAGELSVEVEVQKITHGGGGHGNHGSTSHEHGSGAQTSGGHKHGEASD